MKRSILKNISTEREKLKSTSLIKEKTTKSLKFISTGSTMLNLSLTDNVDNGYPIGRVINPVGDFSTGKCIKNAYIITKDGMFLIDSFIKNMENKEIRPCFKTIASVNNELVKTQLFYAEKVNQTTKISTKFGFELEGTEKHPIMVWENCSFKMKKLSEINIGDFVVIQKGMDLFPKHTYEFSKTEKKKQNKHTKDFSSIDWQIPDKMNNALATLLGYLVADGNFMKNAICISNTKPYIIDSLNKITTELNLNYGTSKYISGKIFSDFLFALFDCPDTFTARYKYVPKCIMQSNKEHQANFIRGLFDCDSYSKGNQLEYYTASKCLAKQIQMMLLNFGIFSTKNSKWNEEYQWDYYTIRVCAGDIQTYKEQIGSIKYAFDKIDVEKSMTTIPNLLSKIWKDIETTRKLYGWSKNGRIENGDVFPKFNPTKRTGDASHGNVQNLIDLYSDYMDTKFYKKLMKYHFAKVTTKEIKNEKTWVYDFTIPKNHLFWSNGMISHNTLMACEAINCAWHIEHLLKKKKVKIYYDEPESAFDFKLARNFNMPLEHIYGLREQLPGYKKQPDDFKSSKKVEDMYSNLKYVVTQESKHYDLILYVIDSLDSLQDAREVKHIEKKGIEKADFGGGKARILSQMFRDCIQPINDSNVLLFIISQIRTNFGVMFGPKFTRAGGKALDFYASQIYWLYERDQIRAKNNMMQGITVDVKCTKNKVGSRYNDISFNILHGYGIDNISSVIDFLWQQKAFEISGAYLKWEGKKYYKKELITKTVNDPSIFETLKYMAQEQWDSMLAEAAINRNPKYGG